MATDLISPLLSEYVNLAARALAPRPSRVVHVNPGGEVPWDECCAGQLAGRIITKIPRVGDQRSAAGLPCGVLYWDVTLALSIIRCIHVVIEDGPQQAKIPTTAEMDADGMQMLADLAVLEEVILCHPRTTAMQSWVPLGAQGGCAGGEWVFVARVPGCPCP